MKLKCIWLCVLLSSSFVNANDLSLKTLEELMGMEVESKVEVGSRSGSRNFLDSMVPIDVITQKQISNSGLKRLTEVMSYFIPGFNAPRPAIKDGSDHIQAFTLRGLNPDQVLVLLNGKRMHSSALVHVNDTVGRGTSGVDLNTIPVISIERVEILRDGAAAQYGSDAIAGVINIVLKSEGYQNEVGSKIGVYKEGDGRMYQTDMFYSYPLDYDGYINISAELRKQESTDRSGVDTRDQYVIGDGGKHRTTKLGQAESLDYLLGINSLASLKDDIDIYTHAILNYKDSENNAYFRTPISDRNDVAVYPDGFLPFIQVKVLDYSLSTGISQDINSDSSWDLSQTIGGNDMHFYVHNSLNDSIGVGSPSSFDNGGMNNFQAVTNLDYKTKLDEVKVALGLEYKYESYELYAGDRESYSKDSNKSAGSQGFPGFSPENEVDESRSNYSAYLDINYEFVKNLLVSGAIRFENYSDFGSTDNYKLALSYQIDSELLFRTSASTGFKAPSLGQSYYTSNSTTISASGVSSTGTFTPEHELSQALGATTLTPEESKHATAGFVYKPMDEFSLSLDYFYTKIDDRIMLSTDILSTSATQALFTKYDVTKVRYFTNAVNTTTKGIDLRINYLYELVNGADLSFNALFSYAQTKVDSFNDMKNDLARSVAESNRIENAQAKDNVKLLVNYDLNSLNIALNMNRYGKYKDVYDGKEYSFGAQWSSDLDVAYTIKKNTTLALGGTNIFDSYPDKWGDTQSAISGGIVPYSQYSPIGYNGAFYYVRIAHAF